MTDPTARIIVDLDEIERDERVKVLLAVESGSRAWGFASTDSDFDVRFIYVRQPNWYLSIDVEERSDVIERPLRDELDISGWDARKALRLFRKSNPPLLEWLQSPIIYRERFSFVQRLRELLPEYYSPKATLNHYLHRSKGNMREYLTGETVWRKKYLYVLRPLLAMRWIEADLGPVPIEFGSLLDELLPAGEVRSAIDHLVAEKKRGAELDRGPRINVISDFIETEMAFLEGVASDRKGAASSSVQLDDVFRATLAEAWSVRP